MKMNEFGIVIYHICDIYGIYGIKDLRHEMKYQRNGYIFLNMYITEWNSLSLCQWVIIIIFSIIVVIYNERCR